MEYSERMRQIWAEIRAEKAEHEVQTKKIEQVHDGLEELWESRNLPDQEKQSDQEIQEKTMVALEEQGRPQERDLPEEPDEEFLFNKDLVLRTSYLPATIEELREFILLNSEKLNAYRARVRAVDKLSLAKELKDKAVEEGQILAGEVFKAEAKLGELLKGLSLRGGDRKSESFQNQTSSAISLKSLGITEKQSYEAQKMAANPYVIEEVLEKAIRENEIPYKAEILRRIDQPELKIQRDLKVEEKRREIQGQLDLKDLGGNNHEHLICLHHMDRICLKLLPRLYKYELSMEELLEEIKILEGKGEKNFKIVSEQKPIKDFLGSCFTQDFIAILQTFGFKIEWPEGVTLSPRTNRYKRVKAQRKRMAYYRRKGRLWY